MPYILEETRLFGRGRSAVGPVRPLVLEAPDDPSVVGIDFAYDLGPDIRVAPIVTGRSTALIALSKGHWQSLYRPHCRVPPADPARAAGAPVPCSWRASLQIAPSSSWAAIKVVY